MAILEIISRLLDFVFQYLPDFLDFRRKKKAKKEKQETLDEMDKAKKDVIEGNEEDINKRMEEYRKNKDLK